MTSACPFHPVLGSDKTRYVLYSVNACKCTCAYMPGNRLHVRCVCSRLTSYSIAGSTTSYFRIGKKEVNISKIRVPDATDVTEYNVEVKPKQTQYLQPAIRIRPHTAAAHSQHRFVNWFIVYCVGIN